MVNRKSIREQMKKRIEESHNRKDATGRFGTIFKEDVSRPFWKCSADEHLIDIIPFVAGPDMPLDPKTRRKQAEEGEYAYVLDIWVHRGVGVNEDSYVCPANYGKPCPICEYRKELRDQDASDDEIRKLNRSRRTIYNIVCYDSEEEERKGVQIWDVAYQYMEEELLARSKKKRTGEPIIFADPEVGKSISFIREGTGKLNTTFKGHEFVDRVVDGQEYVIPDEILEQALPLDQIIHVPTYEELYEAFFGEAPPDRTTREEQREESRRAAPSRSRVVRKEEKEESVETSTEVDSEAEKSKSVSDNPCPAGGRFGVDIEKLPECAECEVWDECAREEQRLLKEKEEQEKKATSLKRKPLRRR